LPSKKKLRKGGDESNSSSPVPGAERRGSTGRTFLFFLFRFQEGIGKGGERLKISTFFPVEGEG